MHQLSDHAQDISLKKRGKRRTKRRRYQAKGKPSLQGRHAEPNLHCSNETPSMVAAVPPGKVIYPSHYAEHETERAAVEAHEV